MAKLNGGKLIEGVKEASRHFRKKKNIRDLYRGMNEFKRGYQLSDG
jgi:hypothetical protein